ncbi:MAG: hypothetical protein ABIK09_20800 [Pseudomonadota bacterium]
MKTRHITLLCAVLLTAAPAAAGERLAGIPVEEVDWAPLLEGKDPVTDPLAAAVPAGQFVVFFKGLRGMIRLVDEARRAGALALSWLEAPSGDARTRERYQDQLCLSLEGLNRFIGPLLTRSVAVTGSDPFLRSGADVAVIFETDNDALFLYMALRHYAARAENPGARTEFGLRGRQVFYGLSTPDRRISSWVMRIPDLGLVVTNSRTQIDAIAATLAGDRPAMRDAPEYRFFRDRYPRADREEDALLVVPDADVSFRQGYQKSWRRIFDPLAARFVLHARTVGVDLSICPLIRNSGCLELNVRTADATAATRAGPGLRRGPLARILDANLGLSLESGGLRVRVRVTRSID